MLSVRNLHVRYGAIVGVRDVSLDVGPREIVALIGANGAGKTTTVRAIAGLLPRSGEVTFEGRPIPPERAEAVVAAGLSLVPEGRGILGRMSVEENLLLGAYCRRDRRSVGPEIDDVMRRFPVLGERRSSAAGLLSGGEQQMLAVARALLARPRLLVLDEPSLGLAPLMIARIFELIEELRDSGLAILLVEQKARQTLKVADRAYLLETGRIVAQGTGAELAAGSVVADAFLGGARASADAGPVGA